MTTTLTHVEKDFLLQLNNSFNSQSFDLERYGISRKTGFLPEVLPLLRLPPSFESWECLLDALPELLKNETYRDEVLKLPVLNIYELPDLPSKQRAFTVLTFLSSAYIWGYHLTQPPLHVLPFALAQPLTQLAMFLGLRPISCYTSVSLWNFSVSKSYDLEGLHSLHSFTGTEDESWFYMVPLAIEMVSTPCIQAILDAFEAMHSNQPDLLYDSLKVMETSLSKMVSLLPKMTQKCNPALFFTTLRPFLAGWSHVPPSTSYPEGGVVFEHVHAMPTAWKAQPTLEGCLLHCAGGSAGQTPTIQVLDAFLGIRHASKMYYAMRDYLSTGFHEFIEFVESFEPSLPMYLGHMDRRRSECTQLFNVLIQHLTSFRNLHLKIVAQYIVSQQYKGGLGSSKQAPSLRVHELKGTGNTLLMPFLKETRDETERCILENS